MQLDTRLTVNDYVAADSEEDDSSEEMPTPKGGGRARDERAPFQRANVLSRLTFSWISAMFKTGYKRPVEIDDLEYLPRRCFVDRATATFQEHWFAMKEESRSKQRAEKNKQLLQKSLLDDDDAAASADGVQTEHPPPNLLRALLSAFGGPFYRAAPLKVLSYGTGFAQVALVSAYLTEAQSTDENTAEFMSRALLCTALIFLNSLLGAFCDSQFDLYCEMVSVNMKAALCGEIYQKLLRVSKIDDSGQTLTLITVDMRKISWIMRGVLVLVLLPIEFVVTLVLLYLTLDWSVFVALAVQLATNTPIVSYTVRKIKGYQREIMGVRDSRMKLINEVFKSIQVLKMYGWVPSFDDKISRVRDNEVRLYRILQCSYKFMWFCWEVVPVLLALVSYAIFTANGGALTAQKAFVSLHLFYKLRGPIQRVPGIILGLIDAKVSLDRTTKFLVSKEIDPQTIEYPESGDVDADGPLIWCRDASLSWDAEGAVAALSDLNVAFERRSITMIVGETGSGKSALLQGLLGNLHRVRGSIHHSARSLDIAFSAQTAWIQNATIRENICFGREFDVDFYHKVVAMCALRDDLKILIAGDETEIGEKGVNLSGGQKQRLSLARAVYADADIFIFDDPLSAVDSHVAAHIFNECIAGHLLKRGKTVVLATHSIAFLDRADNVVVMERGKIAAQGTLQQLRAEDINFAAFAAPATDSDDGANDEEADDKKSDDRGAGKSPAASPRGGALAKHRRASADDGKLCDAEERREGRVDRAIYALYVRAGYGPLLLAAFLSVALIYLIFENTLDVYWLAHWADAIAEDGTARRSSWFYLGVYVGLRAIALLLLVAQIAIEILSRLKAARFFHKLLLRRVLNAPMSFFDTTPIGRVISRFSKDINAVDDSLTESFKDALRSTFGVVCNVAVTVMVIPWLLIPMVPLYGAYYLLQKYFLSTSRELKRLISISSAPIYSHFAETMAGSNTIRAFGRTPDFVRRNEERCDRNQQSTFALSCGYRWFGIRLHVISQSLVVMGGALCAVTKPSAGFIGIVLTMTQHITGTLNWFVDRVAQMEQDMVSVERIHQYSEQKGFVQEQSQIAEREHGPLPTEWPLSGEIAFRSVFMRYREGLPDVLRGLSFSVRGGERVGIIGRTGAGKSSLFATLLRLVEIERGRIEIGGEDIGAVELQELRSRISIIPQEPVLFSGDIRFNLDPFNPTTMSLAAFLSKHDAVHLLPTLKRLGVATVDGLHSVDSQSLTAREAEPVAALRAYLKASDEKLVDALRVSHCHHLLARNAERGRGGQSVLDIVVEENGGNFSVGERQLICLSRAIVRKSPILLLDEATSSVDAETDKAIQQTIRSVFEKQTILTIAHRIDTILDYDRILIMDNGKKMEFDTPSALLCDEKSMFTQIVQESFGLDAENVQRFLKEHCESITPSEEAAVSAV